MTTAVMYEALKRAERVMAFDLNRMIVMGDDYNQAVRDAYDSVVAARRAHEAEPEERRLLARLMSAMPATSDELYLIAREALEAIYKNALGGDPATMARVTADLAGDALLKLDQMVLVGGDADIADNPR